MSVFRRSGSKIWYVTVTINGTSVTKSAKTTRKSEAYEYEEVLRQKLHAEEMLGEGKEVLLKTALYDYWRKIKDRSNGPNVHTYIGKMLGKKWDSHKPGVFTRVHALGNENTMLHEIKTEDVTKYVQERRNEGTTVDATIKLELTTLRMTMQHAKRRGYKINPNIEWPNDLEKARRIIAFLTPEQETALLIELERLVKKYPNELRYLDSLHVVIFLLDTGTRIGECCQLKFSSINMDEGSLYIYRHKTKSYSVLPISSRLRSVLEQRIKNRRFNQDYVFESKPGQPRATHSVGGIRKALKKIGLPNFRIHDFRHHFATKMINQDGIDLYDVKELLGHQSYSSTQRYAHLKNEKLRKKSATALDRINEENTKLARKENIRGV